MAAGPGSPGPVFPFMSEYRVGLHAGRIEEAATFEAALLILMVDQGTENMNAVRLIRVDNRWTGIEFEKDGIWAGIIYCPAEKVARQFPGEPLHDAHTGAKICP